MTYQLVVRPAVASDLREAEVWYENQRAGLGAEFLDAALESLERLIASPLIYAVRFPRKKVCFAYVHRFPYRVIFRVIDNTVVVFAVLHSSRHDRHWKNRI
jgi:plasmid stabilization system protein ParE